MKQARHTVVATPGTLPRSVGNSSHSTSEALVNTHHLIYTMSQANKTLGIMEEKRLTRKEHDGATLQAIRGIPLSPGGWHLIRD
jgi:hypothetical protein